MPKVKNSVLCQLRLEWFRAINFPALLARKAVLTASTFRGLRLLAAAILSLGPHNGSCLCSEAIYLLDKMFTIESARLIKWLDYIDEAAMISNLLKDRREHLKHVQTEVRYPDGQVVIENGSRSGSSSPIVLPERRLGFIPDFTPDLQVAVVLPGLLMGEFQGS